jgi:hypothetical protein
MHREGGDSMAIMVAQEGGRVQSSGAKPDYSLLATEKYYAL